MYVWIKFPPPPPQKKKERKKKKKKRYTYWKKTTADAVYQQKYQNKRSENACCYLDCLLDVTIKDIATA